MYKLTTINPPLAILKERKSTVRPRPRHPIQPSASTHVVAELHKEALQATGGPTSLEDLSKLIPNVEVDFMDLESPEDDTPIIIQDEDGEEVHAENTLNSKLVKEKDAVETEVALLKAKPSFPNVEHLTELLVNSLKPKLLKLLSSHDLSNSLPTELKELPSKFKDITREIRELKKYVEKLEIELLGDLKEIPTKLEKFTSTVSSLTTQVSEMRTLQWDLPAEFLAVTKALDRFAQALEYASQKASDQSVHSAGQAGTHLAEGEKNTRQAIITQFFQQRAAKANLNSQPLPTTSPITTTNKGKEAMTLNETEGEESDTDSKTEVRPTSSMVESSKKKKLKKFDFVTEEGDHVHFTEEKIKEQKRIEELVKADLAKKEEVVGKEELIDLLGIDVVTNVY
ncbi:hypothetical protein Tco_1444850 [Tanacetum coccineum]